MNHSVDNGLTEAQADALATLAHIAIGSLSHTVERHAASALLDYMSSLERQRGELRQSATARDSWQPIASAPVNVPVLVSGLHTDDQGRWVVLAIQDGGTWFRCYLDGRHNGTEVMPPTSWITPPKESP